MKPGSKTTEFWLTAISLIGIILLAAVDRLSPEVIGGIAGVVGTYNISRGVAKVNGSVEEGTANPEI